MLNGEDARTLSGFSNVSLRNGFIRKVYGIVGSQFLLTTAVAIGIIKIGESQLQSNSTLTLGLILASSAMMIGTMCIFCCCPQLMRTSPTNYIILFLFTLAEAIVVGLVSVQYTIPSVIMALGITCGIVFALTIFACQTKFDFTGCGPYLLVGCLCLMVFGLFTWLGSWFLTGEAFHTLRVLYACGGAFLMSCYIIYDTQLIVGGKHQRAHEFSIDDYAFAALSLYIDIVQLFLYLLQIFGQRR